ncbi:DeoR/GlpR family DNA-binding transcription regulator [Aureliella helgolandensis]|uniref:Glycerol-3-phosphate regulon repressor n=1 Tax=Aureliella helgolandensis TaxID=2527968 RepID=A0A518G069_9BACT|nr:DeoR/GlpR family DNA-binding transcription regulator [Aureliella helgolandensis]QDV21991.1 Glycerol-3-phosphate regulon repressor [Aureliella helgolandensis]
MSNGAATDLRRLKLRELIRSQGFVSIPDLRSSLDVSESTIRRDLDFLEAEGEAKRTHGGVFSTGPTSSLGVFETRRAEQWEKKRRIAVAASKLVENHDTLLLDGGSTTYELAKQLVGRPLQVVTNSLPLANLYAASDQIDLVLLGGYVHSRTGVSLGPYANEMLSSLNVQTAVLSIAGADRRGFYNSNLLLVETERAMMDCADRTVIVADSSKFGKCSLARLCGLHKVHVVVSDDDLSEEWQNHLLDAGVELVLAGSDPEHADLANQVGGTTAPENETPKDN